MFIVLIHCVTSACTFEMFIYGGLMRSFGVFFLQYQLRFGSNASQTAIMNLIQNLVLSVTGKVDSFVEPF